MIDMLKSIGIEKGKPFVPMRRRWRPEKAAREARAWLDSNYEDCFTPPFYAASRWAVPASPDVIEGHANIFHDAGLAIRSKSRASRLLHGLLQRQAPGAGQFYLMTIKDKDGKDFDGGETYRLNVPANAPVNQYWSATVYDRATHALYS